MLATGDAPRNESLQVGIVPSTERHREGAGVVPQPLLSIPKLSVTWEAAKPRGWRVKSQPSFPTPVTVCGRRGPWENLKIWIMVPTMALLRDLGLQQRMLLGLTFQLAN